MTVTRHEAWFGKHIVGTFTLSLAHALKLLARESIILQLDKFTMDPKFAEKFPQQRTPNLIISLSYANSPFTQMSKGHLSVKLNSWELNGEPFP